MELSGFSGTQWIMAMIFIVSAVYLEIRAILKTFLIEL